MESEDGRIVWFWNDFCFRQTVKAVFTQSLTCNRNKGSDIASVVPGTERLVRFFSPRAGRWNEHFSLDRAGVTILALTEIGEATARIFGFNTSDRLLERQALQIAGRYPTEAARRRISGAA